MSHKSTLPINSPEHGTDGADRSAASGYLLVILWMFAALFLLVLLFLLQAQFVGQSRPDVAIGQPTAESTNTGSGESFLSYAEFIARQRESGFVFLGRFADDWPATALGEHTARNEIAFEWNGRKHRYPGFDGYRLKVVRLKTHRGAEAVVVLRSREKE